MAVANRNTVRAVVENRLAAELANDPVLPVVFYNMAYEPTPGSSWVQCLLSFGSGEYLTHGSTTDASNRVVGIVVLNVFTPLGVGAGANYTIAKRIRDLYNRVIVSGVYFDAPIGPEALGSPSPEGYFQTQVRVTFEFIEEL